MVHNSYNSLSGRIRCVICNRDIKNLQGVYQSKAFHGIVCRQCTNMFSPDDIEMMFYLFFLYGGYFGKEKDEPFSIQQLSITLMLFSENMKQEKELVDFEEVKQKAMHQALLHGITPEKFSDKLKKFLN